MFISSFILFIFFNRTLFWHSSLSFNYIILLKIEAILFLLFHLNVFSYYILIIFFPFPSSCQILFTSLPSELNVCVVSLKNKYNIKTNKILIKKRNSTNKKPTRKPEFILCWPATTPRHGAYPRVWLTRLVALHWKNTDFLFTVRYWLWIVS